MPVPGGRSVAYVVLGIVWLFGGTQAQAQSAVSEALIGPWQDCEERQIFFGTNRRFEAREGRVEAGEQRPGNAHEADGEQRPRRGLRGGLLRGGLLHFWRGLVKRMARSRAL